MALDEIHEWDQYPNESAEAWRAFNCYKRLPPHRRTFAEAWKLYNPDQAAINPRAGGSFTRWTKKFHWKIRAEAYDAHLESVNDQTKESAFSKDQLEERMERKRLMKVTKHFFVLYSQQLEAKAITANLTPVEVRTLAQIMAIYNDQSREEFHDKGSDGNAADQTETIAKISKGIRKKIQQEIARDDESQGSTELPEFVQ